MSENTESVIIRADRDLLFSAVDEIEMLAQLFKRIGHGSSEGINLGSCACGGIGETLNNASSNILDAMGDNITE